MSDPTQINQDKLTLLIDFAKNKFYIAFPKDVIVKAIESAAETDAMICFEDNFTETFGADNNTKLMFK